MEKSQDIHQRPEGWVPAICQDLLTDFAVALPQVELEAIGWLGDHLSEGVRCRWKQADAFARLSGSAQNAFIMLVHMVLSCRESLAWLHL